jgi:MEMO1 family protein
MTTVRDPALAGMFYPEDPADLRRLVEGYLDNAVSTPAAVPKAVIVPHAGYIYSGSVAGSAYARLRAGAGGIRRVVLLGPAHRAPLLGLALPEATVFASPLGRVPVDGTAVAELMLRPEVSVNASAHALEHSLEVQLPFIQLTLGHDFTLVPLAIGETSPEQVAAVLDALWGGAETLVVVSSDLSHYHDYETARHLDAETSRAIESLAVEDLRPDRACGCLAIQGLLLVARQRGLSAQTVDLRNSGDTSGGRDQVVGYGAYVFA